jgi:sugar lactone lactonase YvrE
MMQVSAKQKAVGKKGEMILRNATIAVLLAAGCAGVPAQGEAPTDILINGSRIFPESITSDENGNIYNSSNSGTIYRTLPGETSAEPWIVPDEHNGLLSTFGVLADDNRGLLWVCSNPPFGGPPRPGAKSTLKAFDLETGALSGSYDFPGEGPFTCNDITVGRFSATYASDTSGGRIFKLEPGANELALFAADPTLVGIDGLAFGGDGELYINNVRANTMQRVEINGGSFGGLTTLTLSEPISGPDGLRRFSGNRFLQAEGSGNRVTWVDIEGDNATITPVKTGLESSPGVTFVGKIGYATEGKIAYLFNPALRDQDPDPFHIRAFPLPEAP